MNKDKDKDDKMEKIISLCKRRGFVFPGSEIYGGLAGFWDYGHLGLALKNNIKNLWWKRFVIDREDVYGIDAAIVMRQEAWQASGHVSGFSDPVVVCKRCGNRWRTDHIIESQLAEKEKILCPNASCRAVLGTEAELKEQTRRFNMMFKTYVGATEDDAAVSYLRPETAQGIFVNFKNTIDAYHPKLPFGIAQIGKAFRNEIAPRDFLFRSREFEQMEIEFLVRPGDWEKYFEHFRKEMVDWTLEIGLKKENVHELEVSDADRAFYSKRTIDFEYDFPFGRKELYGLAYRTDYDLKKHGEASSVDLNYLDEETKEKFIPHCIEPSFGLDRTVLAILSEAYTEDEMNGEKRVYLKLKSEIAPIKVAVFPLLKNKPELVKKAREVYQLLRSTIHASGFAIEWDDNGNIGKRYRRQDEIGTPKCITVDFQTLEDDNVTVRDRDTGKQERVKISDLIGLIGKL